MKNIDSEYLVIEGGKKLFGEVEISGAKNSVLKLLAATLILPKGEITLHAVPNLRDVNNMVEIMSLLGSKIKREGTTLYIDNSELSSNYVPFELASKLRASIVTLGALTARFKEARVSLPGGCLIGARKLDLHLKGLKALGANITEEQGSVLTQADKLIGTKIYLDIPSNGATENILLAAVVAEGETVIENAARDPEIIDLANFLNKMGCDIRGAGTNNIQITGKKLEELHACEHTTIPDRIEAATYLTAGMMTRGKVTIKNVIEEDLQSLLSKYEDIGASITIHNHGQKLNGDLDLVDITLDAEDKEFTGTDVTTVWYPGFPTDAQPIFAALLSISQGTSIINENIYDSRFQHVEELNRMKADIEVNGKVAVVKGVEKLQGTAVHGKDLRSTAALVTAALAAEGTSEVRGLEYLDRGYEHLEDKLIKIGANIKRVTKSEETTLTEKPSQVS